MEVFFSAPIPARGRLPLLLGTVLMVLLPSFSAAGGQGRILYSTLNSGAWELAVIRPDGSGYTGIAWVDKNVRSPALSPDQSELAAITQQRHLKLYSGTGKSVALKIPAGIYAQPAWRQDGSALAYVRYKVKPSDQSEIWLLTKDKQGRWGRPERVTEFPPMRLYPSFSPDGKFLLYTEFHRDRLHGVIEELGLYNFKEKQFIPLTEDRADSFYGRWSPDGKHIVYVSNKSGNYDIWLLSFDATQTQPFTQKQLTRDSHFDGEPAWSPDGREIVFVSSRSGVRELWRLRIDGKGTPKQVTRKGSPCKEPLWYEQRNN